jgi:hypothetical protein
MIILKSHFKAFKTIIILIVTFNSVFLRKTIAKGSCSIHGQLSMDKDCPPIDASWKKLSMKFRY